MPKWSPEELREALKQIRLFADLPEPVLDRLTPFTLLRRVRAGESIFLQTEPSPYFFGILTGRVQIQRVSKNKTGPAKRLGDLGPGEVFGESALFGRTLRTATATALTDGSLVVITGQSLQEWVQTHPEHGVPLVMGILQSAMDRLQKTSLELSMIHGVERLLNGSRPLDDTLPEALAFIESSLPGMDQISLFTRQVSQEAYTRRGPGAKNAIAFASPLAQQIRESETVAPIPVEELDGWKICGPLVEKDMQSAAAVPLWNRDQYPAVLEGFLVVASRQLAAVTHEVLKLLTTVSQTIAEELLRERRIQESQAFDRISRQRPG